MIRLAAFTVVSLYFILITIDAAPLQTLPQKPGYVPVYIRYGDTPLEEINPGLAVAFREFGGEARNFRDGDKEEMLADEAPKEISSSESESKEATKAPASEGSSSESKSAEKDIKEEPKALPVKKETEKKVQ
ncbi:uncharacterized protein LOC134831728 [Culicoides brevitarsis]|uniref:uncharacterized protein LOC134831728 n=1 Tax=Culicoides brevitarsis TaxID=469753 RepID=UPI00307B90AD